MSQNIRKDDIEISVITNASDLAACHDIASACFGHQNPDAIHYAFNPGWETVEGRDRAIKRLTGRWSNTSTDSEGRPNTIFVKATIPTTTASDSNTATNGNANRLLVGYAIWVQFSCVDGHGDSPDEDFIQAMNLKTLYPGNEKMQRCVAQMVSSLNRDRFQVVRSKAHSVPSSVMALDLCVVEPKFQGRGIGRRLVQWGLDEAEKRGGLECVLEASAMGKGLYKSLGFVQQGGEISYDEVEDKNFIEGQTLGTCVFMRTQPDKDEI